MIMVMLSVLQIINDNIFQEILLGIDFFKNMGISDLLQLVSIVVLGITAIGIFWYSFETMGMKQEMINTNRINIRPILVFYIRRSGKNQDGSNWRLRLRNTGNGPAFNLKIENISQEEIYKEIEFFIKNPSCLTVEDRGEEINIYIKLTSYSKEIKDYDDILQMKKSLVLRVGCSDIEKKNHYSIFELNGHDIKMIEIK